jgi:short-subunit dehydrogenase
MTLSGYCAGKFALEGFGESLALEVAPLGVHVSLLEPGLVMTPHFTVRRGRASAAIDPRSFYYPWFVQHEKIVDDILRAGRLTPLDVAKAAHRALTDSRPKLRYVVGARVKLLIALRRYLPGELFERLYSRRLVRMVTRPATPAEGLSDLSSYDDRPSESKRRADGAQQNG